MGAEKVIECWGGCRGTGTHQQSGEECRVCRGTGRILVEFKRIDGTPPSEVDLDAALRRYKAQHVLEQDQVWYNREGDEILLEDMSLRYLKNVLAFVERRAAFLKARAEAQLLFWCGQPHGDMAQDALDSILAEVLDQEPTTWLYGQPLVARLDYLVKIEHDGPFDGRPLVSTVDGDFADAQGD